MKTGIINKIYDSSLVDGPGNRMSVFFQGCNMNCWYCHNPETIGKCINCGECIAVCPTQALSMIDGKVNWKADRCEQCDRCVKTCRFQSSPKVKSWSVQQLIERMKINGPYIRGITCSGGECTLNKAFITEFFGQVKEEIGPNYSCLLDSNGSVLDFEHEVDLMAVTDGVMLDIKSMDPVTHQQLTGVSNQLVISNAIYLARIDKLTELRTVVTAHELDARDTIRRIAKHLEPYQQGQQLTYRLIRFRKNGVRSEYENLGSPSLDEMEELATYAREHGFQQVIIT